MNSKRGLTLIELLVTLTLILALTSVVLLSMDNVQKNSASKRLQELNEEIELASDVYLNMHGEITEKLLNGEEDSECVKIYKLIEEGLLRNELINPVTGERVPASLCVNVTVNDGVVESSFNLE